jgi:hypothetical protein
MNHSRQVFALPQVRDEEGRRRRQEGVYLTEKQQLKNRLLRRIGQMCGLSGNWASKAGGYMTE